MGNQLSCKQPKDIYSIKGSIVRQKQKKNNKKKRGEETEVAEHQQEQQALGRLVMQRGRSSSSRRISTSNQDAKLAMNLESEHFVLIHGGGYGAWCWYKSMALLEESGLKATAIDLTASGIDPTDPNAITSINHYVKPLTNFLQSLPEGDKVILVGHDFGGACISYTMEHFPHKIAKAVFVAATMIGNGQRAYDAFDPKVVDMDNLLSQAQTFVYANGSNNSPTSIEFNRKLVKEFLLNQSPAKDIALASVSLRAIPFAPVLEKLCLTQERYGQVPRYFIIPTKDFALTPTIQENIVMLNPPKRVFKLKGSDHCPFFSKPQGLHNIFMEIAQLK